MPSVAKIRVGQAVVFKAALAALDQTRVSNV